MLKLVTFDVTGTLLFFQTPIFEKYIQSGLKFGLKVDTNNLGKSYKEAWKTLNAEHPNFGSGGLGWEKWWTVFVQKTFNTYLKPGEEAKASQIAEDLIAFHTTKEAFAVRAGTEELLEYLKLKSVSLGVVSNYDPRLHQILEIMDLRKYFNFVLTSYEFGHTKPDKRIFLEALRLGNCSRGEEAMHVGDDIETDYLGAAQAGLRAIWINSNETSQKEIDKDNVCKDFYELKQHFEKLYK